MRAAVRAVGAQLEAVQAIDAAVAAGQVGVPQPRLSAAWALGPELDLLLLHGPIVHHRADYCLRSRPMKNPSVPWRWGRTWRNRPSRGEASSGRSAPSSSAANSG